MTVLPGENVPRALLDANRANYRLLEDINTYGALAFDRKANIIKERTDAQLSLAGLDSHLHAPTILTVAQRWLGPLAASPRSIALSWKPPTNCPDLLPRPRAEQRLSFARSGRSDSQ